MATVADWLKIDPNHITEALNEAMRRLPSTDGEIVLDFSAVPRLDAAALNAMAQLTEAATAKGTKLVLKGVNIGVYKVFKLANLTSRFSCIS